MYRCTTPGLNSFDFEVPRILKSLIMLRGWWDLATARTVAAPLLKKTASANRIGYVDYFPMCGKPLSSCTSDLIFSLCLDLDGTRQFYRMKIFTICFRKKLRLNENGLSTGLLFFFSFNLRCLTNLHSSYQNETCYASSFRPSLCFLFFINSKISPPPYWSGPSKLVPPILHQLSFIWSWWNLLRIFFSSMPTGDFFNFSRNRKIHPLNTSPPSPPPRLQREGFLFKLNIKKKNYLNFVSKIEVWNKN